MRMSLNEFKKTKVYKKQMMYSICDVSNMISCKYKYIMINLNDGKIKSFRTANELVSSFLSAIGYEEKRNKEHISGFTIYNFAKRNSFKHKEQ